MGVVAIVPLKALSDAKRRLAPELDARHRRKLVATLFETVVRACLASAAVDRVLVVAGDTAAVALARPLGVEVVLERRRGLPAAMAAAEAATRDAAATVVVMADLPLVTGRDVDTVCAAGRRGPAVVVAPARDGGTGALLRRPPDVVPTAFGRRSASAHVRLARLAGVPVTAVDIEGLAHDVDTPEQLRDAAVSRGPLRHWADGCGRRERAYPTPRVDRSADVPQGTVKMFDPQTRTGSLLTDAQEEVLIDAEAFTASGLMELRLGQRVRFRVDDTGGTPVARELNVVSL